VPFHGIRRVVLGHIIFDRGIEIDKAKTEVIERLPPLTSVKGVQSFLVHVGFYHRFIRDFHKIADPLTQLLVKDAPFVFIDEFHKAFYRIRQAFISSPNV